MNPKLLGPFAAGLPRRSGAPSAKNVCPSRDELSKPLELMTLLQALVPKP